MYITTSSSRICSKGTSKTGNKKSKNKAPKLPLTDRFVSLAENRTIVSTSEWYGALQDKVDPMYETIWSEKKKYPNLFRLVGKCTETWHANGWEGPYNATNLTYFKNKLVKHIIFCREQREVSHFKDVVSHIAAGKEGDSDDIMADIVQKKKVWVYLHDTFLDYALCNFRTDLIGREK